MKYFVILLFIMGSVHCFAQHSKTSFQGGVEAGFAFTTIQPYQKYYGFFDKLENGKTTQPRAGIFVNHFISRQNQLEMGMYYTERGTAYCTGCFFEIPILFSSDCNGKSLNYLELALTHYYYPDSRSDFSYSLGIGYFQLLGETWDEYDFFKDYDIEVSIGVRFKIKKYNYLKNNLFLLKFEGSLLPISIDKNLELYNNENIVDRFPNERNYAITLSVQHYLK
ncbi:MAG: hypothetical protein ACERKD_05260 [Prolixibacteraceae bacterium]